MAIYDVKDPDAGWVGRKRVYRHGQHVFKTAKAQGWKDDGEGPLEYLIRLAYETGWDDARKQPGE